MSGGVTMDVVREPVGEPVATIGLVHGLGSSATVWNPLVELLPETMRAQAYGLPWDASEGPAWALERDSRVWLDRALKLGTGEPDVYVAHSFGANVLLDRLVVHGTAGCRGLVLLSPFYRPAAEAFDWAAISHYLNDFDDLVRDGILARRGSPKPREDLLEPMVEKIMERIGPYGWMRFFDLFTRTPLLDVSTLDVPCLVIGGGRDTAAYPQDCASLAGALPDARLEILAGCGHFTMIDETVRVAALIGGFLRELGYPTARSMAKGAGT
jgi:pimeloyl-ACP methyl ester carboxylesterase